LLVTLMSTCYGLVQWLRSVSGREKHIKLAKLLDKLTIAGHSHQTAAEVYTEINDQIPLLKEVNHHIGYLLYIFTSTVAGGRRCFDHHVVVGVFF